MKNFLKALSNIVDYMYEDEKENWEECGEPENHIFTSIKIVSDFLDEVYNFTKEI